MNELATRHGGGHEAQVYHQGPSGVPAIREAMEQLKAIRTFVSNELVEGIDFGTIPGTGTKKVMLLPGAQKVCMFMNVYPDYGITATELGDGHVEYLVKTDLISRATERKVGSGIGSCSTKEGKYRFRSGERKCPECDKATIIKGKEEYGGGWLCFKKKGGCGAKFDDGDRDIEGQQVGKVENDNIHDQRNTVLKMAKKRSVVDAAIGLACLADLFTQDIEDTYDLSGTHVPEASAPAHDPAKAEVNASFRPKDRAPRGDGVPKTGKALFDWVKAKERETDVSLLKYLNGWARLQEFPGRMVDWDAEQVALAYAEAVRKVEAIRPAAGRESDNAPGLDLHNWLERERTRIGQNITRWARRWSDLQGYPPDWSTLTVEQADAIHAAAKAKIESLRQQAPEVASQEPTVPQEEQGQAPTAPPARPDAKKGATRTAWTAFVDEAIARWHEFEPIADGKARVARESHLAQGLINVAIKDERVNPGEIGKDDDATKRDHAKVWAKLKELLRADPEYMQNAAAFYLDEKESELAGRAAKEAQALGLAN